MTVWLSCARSHGAPSPTHAQTSSQVPLCRPQPDASDIKHTLSSTARGAAGLLLSASRSAAGLVPKPCNSCASSLDTGPPLSAQLRPSAIVAWISRWSGLLAVASQRAYAASLLELPPAAELGEGPLPELHEVLADSTGSRLSLARR